MLVTSILVPCSAHYYSHAQYGKQVSSQALLANQVSFGTILANEKEVSVLKRHILLKRQETLLLRLLYKGEDMYKGHEPTIKRQNANKRRHETRSLLLRLLMSAYHLIIKAQILNKKKTILFRANNYIHHIKFINLNYSHDKENRKRQKKYSSSN